MLSYYPGHPPAQRPHIPGRLGFKDLKQPGFGTRRPHFGGALDVGKDEFVCPESLVLAYVLPLPQFVRLKQVARNAGTLAQLSGSLRNLWVPGVRLYMRDPMFLGPCYLPLIFGNSHVW